MSFLDIQHLSFSYNNLKVINDISFSIEKGEYIAIIGPNGSGKSTIARLICGFLSPEEGCIEGDAYRTSNLCKNTVPNGIVFQQPEDQLISSIVKKDTQIGPENLHLSKSEVQDRTLTSLELTGLLEKAEHNIETLSSGQKQKLALAGIFALHPELLVLDEAVTMIDPEGRRSILDFAGQQHKNGQSVLCITHDIDEASRADRVIFLEYGHILFDGSCRDFLKKSSFFSSKLPVPPAVFDISHEALIFDSIAYSHTENTTLFENLTFSIPKGSLTAITGKSGSGKTTLLEIASGLLVPKSGFIKTSSRPVLVQQNCVSALFEEFAADDVAYGPTLQGLTGKKLKERVKNAMDDCGIPFSDFADKRISTLSGGQKRKLAIAGVTALNSSIVLFDEPSAGLDPQSRTKIFELFRKMCKEGKTVIFTTHHMDEVKSADFHIEICGGKIKADKKVLEVLHEDSSIKIQQPLNNIDILKPFQVSKSFSQNSEDKKNNTNIIQNLSPVLKYMFMLAFVISGIAVSSIKVLGCICVLCLVYALLAKYPIKKIIYNFLKILPWIDFFFILQILFFQGSPSDIVYFQWNFISVTNSKIHLGILTMLHYVAVLFSISVFLYTTDENDIIDGMKSLLLPLEKLHIPSHHLVLLTTLIFRFIPILSKEAFCIVKTQLIRSGGNLGPYNKKKRFLKGLRTMIPLIIPLIIRTLKKSEALAEALDARYYN